MADSSARRRELRRRKILENSEDRLRKLTTVDRTRPKDLNPRLNETSSNKSKSRDANQEASVIFTHKLNHEDLNKNRHNFHTDTTDEDEDENYTPSTRADQHLNSGNIQALPKILSENKICSKAKLDVNRSACKPANSLQTVDFILQRKWLCVLLAICGRLLGYFLNGSALTKGVTSIFIILEIAFFSKELLSEKEQRPQPQNMLLAALLLCGIQSASRIVQLTTLFSTLIEDFSVFFFTFFMCHWWIEALC